LISVNATPSGNFHFSQKINAKGVGTGQSSGATYQWNDNIKVSDIFNQLPIVFSYQGYLRLIGQGDAPNLRARVQFHTTVNANGEVTADFGNIEAVCD
jgi:hypothetical protein